MSKIFNEDKISPSVIARSIKDAGRLTLGDKKVLLEENDAFRAQVYNHLFDISGETLMSNVIEEVENHLKLSGETQSSDHSTSQLY